MPPIAGRLAARNLHEPHGVFPAFCGIRRWKRF
jgi:hypothetical protein